MNQPSTLPALARQLSLSVYLPSFLIAVCNTSFSLMLPLFALELGANAGMAALVFALRGLGNVVADVPAGRAVSRAGDKFTMILGILLLLVTSLSTGFALSALHLGVAAFALGIGMAVWFLGRLTHITNAVPVGHRGKAIATMAGLQRVGSFFGPVASGAIALAYGFTLVFILLALLAAVALILVLCFVRHQPDHENAAAGTRATVSAGTDPSSTGRDPADKDYRAKGHRVKNDQVINSTGASAPLYKVIPAILREHRQVFATAGVAMLLLTMLRATRQLMIPLWGESIGLNTAEIGYITGAGAALDMCMFPVAGYVMDRWGRKPVATACLAVLTLGLVMMPFTSHAIGLTIAAMVAGVGNGLGSGINMTLGADFSPAEHRGEFLGVWRLLSDTGSFGGPLLISGIIQVFLLTGAFAFAGVAGLAGIVVMRVWVKETLPGERG